MFFDYKSFFSAFIFTLFLLIATYDLIRIVVNKFQINLLKTRIVKCIFSLIILALIALFNLVIPIQIMKGLFIAGALYGVIIFVKFKYLFNIKKYMVMVVLGLSLWSFAFFSCYATTPDTLVDGPYVSKQWNLSSKTQYLLTDLPCDNMIPYLATEFFVFFARTFCNEMQCKSVTPQMIFTC